MISPFVFVLAVLGAFRLAVDLAKEEGPFGLFEKLRAFMQRQRMPAWVKNGSICPVCWSFWTPALTSGLALLAVGEFSPLLFVLCWLAAAGAIRAYLMFIYG